MSAVLRRSSILLVALFIMVTMAPSVAVADESLDWPNEQPVDSSPDLDAIDVEYNSGDIVITVNTTSNGGGDDELLTDNITDVYIDTGDPEGVDDSTFTGSSETATFWSNLDVNADYRVAIGDDTNVVEPWDEDTTQFDGTESESITIEDRDNESIRVSFSEGVIDSPETIDFQAAFVEGDGFDDDDGYAWTDSGDVILEDNGAVISAKINITDADVDDDADISVSAGEQNEGDIDIDGSNNLTAELIVTADEVDEVTATLEGANYTLDETKSVTPPTTGEEKKVNFEPHRLIDVEGDMIGGGNDDYTIELQDNEQNTIVEPQVFDTEQYTFEDINATRLAGGKLVANIADEESLRTVNKTTIDLGDVDRFEPDDPLEIQDLEIEPPTERLEIEANRSTANISKHDTFNVTVNATAEGDDRIDTVKHVIEFDDEQIEHEDTNFVDVEIEDSNGDSVNETLEEAEEGGQYKVIITNTSGDPIVSAGSKDVTLFNLTFKFTDEFGDTESDISPDQGSDGSEDVVLETVDEESRLINSTDSQISTDLEEDDVKDLVFETDSDSVEAYNPETVIEEDEIDVTHLTTGGDMVGAPVRIDIDIGEAATNDGKIDKIVLNNTQNDEDPNQDDQNIDCGGDPTCVGTLVHIPQEGQDSLLENSTYATRNSYNITVIPETGDGNTGDNATIGNPRGDGGEEIYKRGDVTLNSTNDDTGNVTLDGDIDSVLDKSGTGADGGLPWEGIKNAQHDVNNDGEIDVVDVTVVAQEYKPP